jgi:nucleotide-binding universal stress UspA family protein
MVPVDFSAAARSALTWAARYAAEQGAPLLVLHVIHDPDDAPGTYRNAQMSGPRDALLPIDDAAARMMQKFIERFRKSHPGVLGDVDTRMVRGVPETRILEVADEVDARLIAMGSRGRTGLTRVLMGSTAEQVVRTSDRPVVILKDEGKVKRSKKKGKKPKKDRKKGKKDKSG